MSLISAIAAQAPRLDTSVFDDPRLALPPLDTVPVPDPDPRIGADLGLLALFGSPSIFGPTIGPALRADATAGVATLRGFGLGTPLAGAAGAIAGKGDGFVYGPSLAGATDDTRMPPVDQAGTKACGTSSLAMIMNYLGVPVTRQDIDSEVRRVDQGAMPQPLIDYAREHGLNAEGYNHGSWDEMKSTIARGVPVQALINTKADGDPSNGHFVAVVGFRTDAATGKEQIGFRNSADGGKVNWMDRAEFENKWHNHFAGFDNFFIAYAPGGTDLPPGRWDGIEALSAMGDGAWNVMNNFDRITDPDSVGSFVHGLIGLPGGAVQAVGGAVGFGIQTAGDWLDKKVGDIPVLGWVARPVGQVISGIGAGIGNLFGGIGDGINRIGGSFEKLFHGDVGGFFGGLFGAGSKIVGGVFGAVGSVVGGVANAAGSVVNTAVDGVKAVGGAIADGAKAVGKFFSSLF